MSNLFLALLLAGQAHASDLLLHDGDAENALKLAIEHAEVDKDIEQVAFADLVTGRAATVVGRGQVGSCAKNPTTRLDVAEAIEGAEESLTLLELEQAAQRLDAADEVVVCLRDLVDPAQVGRIFYLRGLLAWYGEDEDGAREAWRQGHIIDADLAWDDQFAPDGKDVFDAARDALVDEAFAVLELIPDPDPVHLDGKPVDARDGYVRVEGGRHYLQVGSDPVLTIGVSLETGTQSAVVMPTELRSEVLLWPLEGRESSLSKLLQVTLEKGQQVVIVSGEAVFRTTVGTSTWETLAEPKPPEPEKPPGREPGPGRPLVAVGSGVVVAGGVLAGLSYGQGQGARRDSEIASTEEDFLEAERRYKGAAMRFYIGSGVAVAGAGLLTVGLVQGVDAGALVLPGGGGLRLSGAW